MSLARWCKTKLYLKDLPKVSVVIPAFNEHWSTMIRTFHSITNRTPPELLEEIIMVDDCSNKEFLGDQLDAYTKEFFPKVKIIRLPERSGLITARLAGARMAKAEVLVFFDSHIETGYNWLPPLLEPIAENRKTCVCPLIDVVEPHTFRIFPQEKEGGRGAFDWEFLYKRLPVLKEDLIDKTKPFRSPIMAGGLFAISADFFWELGGYDEGIAIWGGEQYELSFKIWMCGGEMVDAPCSRVSHVYRTAGTFDLGQKDKGDFKHKNFKRVAEVWMDHYKNYLYDRNPKVYSIDPGDLTEQIALRDRLQCKSFSWYMNEIAFDIPKKFPPEIYAHGILFNEAFPVLCLSSVHPLNRSEAVLLPCPEDRSNPPRELFWVYSGRKDIRNRVHICLDIPQLEKHTPVILHSCEGVRDRQLWRYDFKNKWIINDSNKLCLVMGSITRTLFVNNCTLDNANMKWNFGNVNSTAMWTNFA